MRKTGAEQRVVVVGSSVAGVAASTGVRAAGFAGEIVMLGEEPHEPYDRPPLSKQLLCGDVAPDQVALAAARGLEAASVLRRQGSCATGLDLQRRVVELGDNELEFDGIVIATGSTARRLADQPDCEGVHVLRTLDDAVAVRQGLLGAQHVVVIGGGFIGLEVAASARSIGVAATVIEAASSPLSRVVGAEVGAKFVEHHRSHGVEVICGVQLVGFETAEGRVTGVTVSTGETLPADLVVVGVGAEPATGWLASSRLLIDDGVVCDATLRAVPGVYAAGDVARWAHPLFGSIRVEHWMTAVEHGRAAGHNLVAELRRDRSAAQVVDQIPYFWSDQHGVKIQMAGWLAGYDEVIERGGAGPGYQALFGREGRVVAAMGWNEPAFVARARKEIARNIRHDSLSDAGV